MKPTDKKFMGYNFAVASNEYSIYEYVPKEAIVAVLESLHIDLICANIFNLDYLNLSSKQQRDELEKLKKMMLKHIQKEEDNYMLFVFDELYLKNHNIMENNTKDREKMILTRNKIISKSQYLPSILIKRK